MGNRTIVILTQYFAPEMGAPQSRLLEMAIGLKAYGWKVHVITSLPNYPTGKIFREYRGKFSQQDNVDGIVVNRYWIFASNSKKAFPRIVNMLSFSLMSITSIFKIKRLSPTYIITESPPLTLGLTGLLLSKFCTAKHLLNVSDIWPLSAFELGAISKGKLYDSLQRLENYLYRKSYGCLGQSQEIVDHIKQKGVLKVCLFRNGVDMKRFAVEVQQINNPRNKLKIVYAGLLGLAQGIFSLCENLDFTSLGAEFHIYGSGNEEEILKTFIAANPQRSIFYHGKLNREEVPLELAKHDITLIPLQKPIFGAVPSKIYESMAAGLPILFSGGGEGAAIVKYYEAGWVCTPSDFNEMRSIIKKVAAIPESERRAMGDHCKQIAATVFDRSIQIKNLNDFLLQNSI